MARFSTREYFLELVNGKEDRTIFSPSWIDDSAEERAPVEPKKAEDRASSREGGTVLQRQAVLTGKNYPLPLIDKRITTVFQLQLDCRSPMPRFQIIQAANVVERLWTTLTCSFHWKRKESGGYNYVSVRRRTTDSLLPFSCGFR